MGQGEVTVDREPLDFHVQEGEWKFPDLGAPGGDVKDRGAYVTHKPHRICSGTHGSSTKLTLHQHHRQQSALSPKPETKPKQPPS